VVDAAVDRFGLLCIAFVDDFTLLQNNITVDDLQYERHILFNQ